MLSATYTNNNNNRLQIPSTSNSLSNEYDAVVDTVPKKSPNYEKSENYEIGDIILAKMGKYPFWPSIICLDPNLNIFIKDSPRDEKMFKIHVRFLNDDGKRNWVKKIKKFNEEDNKLLSNYPLLHNKHKKMRNQWIGAYHEAIYWLNIDSRQTRMIQFFNAHNLKVDIITTPISIGDYNIPSANIDVKINDMYNKNKNESFEKNTLKRKRLFKKRILKKKKMLNTEQSIHPLNDTINTNNTNNTIDTDDINDTDDTIDTNYYSTYSGSVDETDNVDLVKSDHSVRQNSDCLLQDTTIKTKMFNMCQVL